MHLEGPNIVIATGCLRDAEACFMTNGTIYSELAFQAGPNMIYGIQLTRNDATYELSVLQRSLSAEFSDNPKTSSVFGIPHSGNCSRSILVGAPHKRVIRASKDVLSI